MSTIDEETMQDVAEVSLIDLYTLPSLKQLNKGGNNHLSKQSRKLNIPYVSLMIPVVKYNVDLHFEW